MEALNGGAKVFSSGLCLPRSTFLVAGNVWLSARRYTQVRSQAVVVRRISRYRFCQRSAALASVLFWAGRWGVENATQAASASPPGGSNVFPAED